MKKLIIFCLLYCSINAFSQAPDIEWQNTIGGNNADLLYSIEQTTDRGFILGGYSSSTNTGDKTEVGYGPNDYWVIKLDSSGDIQWQNTIGGSGNDRLLSIQQTTDSGYILGGYSSSPISGDKTEDAFGNNDYWVIKLDSSGNIQWQNDIGGLLDDLLYIAQTRDDGYILGGSSNSGISFDKTENNIGGYDYWVIKLNSVGNIIWQKTIGGSQDDRLSDIKQTEEGGYILGGYSISGISGNKTEENKGGNDYWVLKLDASGNILWQKTIGGNSDDKLSSLQQTNDKGYILGGSSSSDISGDKTEATIGILGHDDFWVVKLDSLGYIEWQNTIGGDSYDDLSCIRQTFDDGYILGGISLSGISGDKSESNFGQDDYWVVRLDGTGNILWQKTVGGNAIDVLLCIEQTIDGGYVCGGRSNSGISGNKIEVNVGDDDYWVVKFSPEECVAFITFYADIDNDAFGNILDTISACVPPTGYVTNAWDCNDTNSAIHPGAMEVCNGIDDNCNSEIDEGIPLNTYYQDADEDGYGNIFSSFSICLNSPPEGYVIDTTDCDDANNLIHEPVLYFEDIDGDFYGDALTTQLFCTLVPPSGYVTDSMDCDDTNNMINPSEIESCNAIDDNCNAEIDEGLTLFTLFIDIDNDSFGSPLMDTTSCLNEISGYVIDSTDCDDSNPDINPGAEEIFNGVDDNCNGSIDEGLAGIENINSVTFEIFPNPNSGEFTITTHNFNSEELKIEAFNLLGEKVYSNKFRPTDKLIINFPSSFDGMAQVIIYYNNISFANLINVIK